MLMLARIVQLVGTVVVAFIVGGILIHLLDANTSNAIVGFIDDTARWLVTPFRDIFKISDGNWRIIVNWGLAAVVYGIAAGIVARLLASASARTTWWRPASRY